MRATKIVATLGPSTDSDAVMRSLFEARVDVFRLNASHGTHDDHAERIAKVRELAAELSATRGSFSICRAPKSGSARLGTVRSSCATIPFSRSRPSGWREPPKLPPPAMRILREMSRPGDPVLLADGSMQLRVIENDGVAARCLVVSGGVISDRKGINLPGVKVSTPSLSKKDVADAHFGVEQGVDFLALSFVRQARDVLRLRHLLDEVDAKQPIIAKIEKPEGWQNLDSILEECDGVMVARGDLGVEMALEKVPAIQKAIIEKARAPRALRDHRHADARIHD